MTAPQAAVMGINYFKSSFTLQLLFWFTAKKPQFS